jgi:Ferritin-like domain
MSNVLRRTAEGHPASEVDAFMSTGGAAATSSRMLLLRRALLATSALGFGGGAMLRAFGGTEAAAASKAADIRILNFFLDLEEIQAFYSEAASAKVAAARVRRFAEVTAAQDRAHAGALRSMLRESARAKPKLRLGKNPKLESEFVPSALKLKEAVVAAYIGQGANLTAPRMSRVASIVSVEARHAAWIRAIAGALPAPRAADASKQPEEVLSMIDGWGIVARR